MDDAFLLCSGTTFTLGVRDVVGSRFGGITQYTECSGLHQFQHF